MNINLDLIKQKQNLFPLISYRCKVLIVGAGSGGCAMAAKLSSKLGKNKVIVVDPADVSTEFWQT